MVDDMRLIEDMSLEMSIRQRLSIRKIAFTWNTVGWGLYEDEVLIAHSFNKQKLMKKLEKLVSRRLIEDEY